MYCPASFREDRLEILHALMHSHRLATLVTAGEGGLLANLIPFTLVEDAGGGPGLLRAHLARANGQVSALRAGTPALVIFQGLQSYVSPSWYATKAETGKVVPTWNYVMVQARGTPRVVDEAGWIGAQIGELTHSQEGPRAEPWHVSDAPEPYIAAQMRAIVGVEIPIAQIEGKWKVSQNHPEANRQGVVDGLRREGGSEAMARLIAERGGLPSR
jgi:transcriptional regulator